jgi:hypothetical protein
MHVYKTSGLEWYVCVEESIKEHMQQRYFEKRPFFMQRHACSSSTTPDHSSQHFSRNTKMGMVVRQVHDHHAAFLHIVQSFENIMVSLKADIFLIFWNVHNIFKS